MRRLHLIELHEQPWYPPKLRRLFREGLGKSISSIEFYRNAAEPFARLLKRVGARTVLDLCSGSAEPLVQIRDWLPLDESDKPKIALSDLFPDLAEFERVRARHPGVVSFYPGPVDARDVPDDAPRFRTMFTALHHFQPDEVRAILRDAAANTDGFAAFEPMERSWRGVLLQLPTPLFAAVHTGLLARPYTLDHLLWGLLIPVLPFTALFDGIVSTLRSYTPGELLAFTREIEAPDFEWEVGQVDIPKMPGMKATYLFGWRTRPGAPA